MGYDISQKNSSQPRRVRGALENRTVNKVFLSNLHTVVVSDKTVYTFGRGKEGQLCHESFSDEIEPRCVISAKSKVSNITVNDNSTLLYFKQKSKFINFIMIFGFSKQKPTKISTLQIVSSLNSSAISSSSSNSIAINKKDKNNNNSNNNPSILFSQPCMGDNFLIFLTDCGKACVLFKLNDLEVKRKLPARWINEIETYKLVKCSVFERTATFVSLCGEIFQFNVDFKNSTSPKCISYCEQIPLKICSTKSHFFVLSCSRIPNPNKIVYQQVYQKENTDLSLSIESPLFNTISFQIQGRFLYSHHFILSQSPLLLEFVDQNSSFSTSSLSLVKIEFPISFDIFKCFLLIFYGSYIDITFLSPLEKSQLVI